MVPPAARSLVLPVPFPHVLLNRCQLARLIYDRQEAAVAQGTEFDKRAGRAPFNSFQRCLHAAVQCRHGVRPCDR